MTEAVGVVFTPMVPIDEPERGWCDPCAKPSILTWTFAVEANGRLLNGRLTSMTFCTDCGVESWEA